MKIILHPLSVIYGIIISLRNTLYNFKFLKTHAIDNSVISIGNITTGGTGKTPLVRYLAEKILKMGYKPGIISRGYGRITKAQLVVHDGKTVKSGWDESGDEPYMLASWLKTVPIIVDLNKVSGAKYLIDNFDVDVILLDDAFQHRKIRRDLDIVLINSTVNSDSLKLLPAGMLREKLENIKRGDILIFTKNTNDKFPDISIQFQNKFGNKMMTSSTDYYITNFTTKDRMNASELQNPGFGFCGIGDPQSFKKGLKIVGLDIKHYRMFKDHHRYNSQTLNSLLSEINELNIKSVITTEKDVIKLPKWFIKEINLFILQVEFVFSPQAEKILLEEVKKVLQ